MNEQSSSVKSAMMNKKKISIQPIEDMTFTGLHWIEASAGTGKTYTLSSLMVRILLEKYLPKDVIATTFTRKASAELKSRIRARLSETLRYFELHQGLMEHEVLAKAAQESDPLFSILLKTFATQIDYTCQRLKLVIDQLDDLFVGTLDSFSQKLLREFSFESGKIERAEITDDAKSYTYQLIHDVLREWIQAQPQIMIDALYQKGLLKSTENYLSLVEDSLNFTSAKMKEVPLVQLNLSFVHDTLNQLACIQEAEWIVLENYYDGIFTTNFSSHALDKKDKNLRQVFTVVLPSIIASLQENPIDYFLNGGLKQKFKPISTIFLDSKGAPRKKIFNNPTKKCTAEDQDVFFNHKIIKILQKVIEVQEEFENQLKNIDTQLKYYLVQEVKKRLPQLLQQKGETTFAQQIRTLAESLNNEQGQHFASFVHAKYPLVLVDEFQDTNQDQDDVLAQIWRHPNRVKKGCMIMVGDRKQAIYGFRGGDMLTFLKAHQDVFGKDGHEYNLVYNQRTVKPLVDVTDALFQRQPDFGEQVIYTPVQAGSRPHSNLMDGDLINPTPLRWLQVDGQKQEVEQVAWKIRALLNQGIKGSLYFEDNDQVKNLNESDIAILSSSNADLTEMQKALEFLGILCNRESRKSVFESQIAQDVGAILGAILHPYQEGKIKRALLSRLFGFNLQALIALEQHADGLSQYIEQFDKIREMWLNQGFLTAWQYLLNQYAVWTNLVATQSRDNERVVVNLRHITELLSQHSEEYQGAQNLYYWYLKQLTSPMEREWELERKLSNEAGVKLMTIHASKGLEFKIVFLLGADKGLSDLNKTLNFSTIEHVDQTKGQVDQQRLVSINDTNSLTAEETEQHDQRKLAEHHRVWYVALTRASHRVYAVMRNDFDEFNKNGSMKAKSTTGLAFWRGHPVAVFVHEGSTVEPLMMDRPARVKKEKVDVIVPLQAEEFPKQRFYARGTTSFSALSRHLNYSQVQDFLAVAEQKKESADDERETQISILPSEDMSAEPISWIKANFPKGTVAGNFLHEIFEHINFNDQALWHLEIHRRFKNNYASLRTELIEKYQTAFPNDEQFEDTLIEWIGAWLQDVLSTPIFPDFELGQLQAHEHLSEFPFYLALSDHILTVQRIHQLFAEENIAMPEFNHANSARYLTGSIDLVFFDGKQYHIADYKSNFLGASQQHYQDNAVKSSMSQASYWLQASLYLVALHRYLKIQLEDYQIERDLGGAIYLYLRGVNGQSEQGYHYWQPSTEFILRLDAILGYFTENKWAEIA